MEGLRSNRAADFANEKERLKIERAKKVQFKSIFTTNITSHEETALAEGVNALLTAEDRKHKKQST